MRSLRSRVTSGASAMTLSGRWRMNSGPSRSRRSYSARNSSAAPGDCPGRVDEGAGELPSPVDLASLCSGPGGGARNASETHVELMHVASSEGPQAQSFPVARLNIEVDLMGDSGFKGFGPCDNEANCLRLVIGGTRTSGPSLVNATPFGQESLSNPAVTLDQKTPPDDPVFEFFLLGRVRVCVGVCIDTGSRADFRLFRYH